MRRVCAKVEEPRRQNLLPEELDSIKARIKAAAYGRSQQLEPGTDRLSESELRGLLRRALRLPRWRLGDEEIASLFAALDCDQAGSVTASELLDFIGLAETADCSGGSARSHSPAMVEPLSPEALERVRSKLKAAAYTGHSGRQLDVLFRRFDQDGSGELEPSELRRAVRRTLRIPATAITDLDILALCRLLDSDRSGSVSIEELVSFIGPEPEVSKRTGRMFRMDASPAKAVATRSLDKIRARIVEAGCVERFGGALLVDVVFRRFDRDGLGELTFVHLRSAVRQVLRIPSSVVSDEEVESLCEALDTDRSGTVAVAEIVRFFSVAPELTERTRRALARSLQRGAPADDEIQALNPEAIERVRSRLKAAAYTGHQGRQLRVLLRRLDADRSGELEPAEFRLALRRTLRIPEDVISSTEVRSLFALLDKNASGAVSIAELTSFVEG